MSLPLTRPVAIVADDEETGRILLADAAVAAGFQQREFDNGRDALEAALKPEVAIVLLDVEMPGMNGFAVCQLIRAARRTSLPIVMVTGREDQAGINRAFDAGATDVVLTRADMHSEEDLHRTWRLAGELARQYAR